METYHLIAGKPSMRADAMLARLLEKGGEYEIVQRDDKGASIKAKFGKASGTFSLTWEAAQVEPFPWCDPATKKKLKDNWGTPRARTQMMWARVVSDAVRTVCPAAVKGNYTPEEVQDFEKDAAPGQVEVVDAKDIKLPGHPAQPTQPASGQPTGQEQPLQELNVTATVVPPNEDPFTAANAKKAAAADFSRCPVEVGGGTLGKPWADFDDATLSYVVQNSVTMQQKFPQITNDHLEFIKGCLDQRQQNQGAKQ